MAFNTSPGRAEYTATAGQTLFTFTFKIYTTANVLVYLTPAGQTPNDITDILIETTDYSITINGDNGGDVTLVSAASAGDSITLVRSLAVDRDVEFQANGDLTAATLNADQDYQTYLLLDSYSDIGRSIKVPDTAQGFTTELPSLEANKMFIVNPTATGIDLLDPLNFYLYSGLYIVSSMSELLSVDYNTYGSIFAKGYYSINDGGGGLFAWGSTVNKSTANAGTIIDPSVSLALQGTGIGTGCWVRQYSDIINVKWFGAVGDGITDDTLAFTNAVSISNVNIYVPFGNYPLTTQVTNDTLFILEQGTIITVLGSTWYPSRYDIAGVTVSSEKVNSLATDPGVVIVGSEYVTLDDSQTNDYTIRNWWGSQYSDVNDSTKGRTAVDVFKANALHYGEGDCYVTRTDGTCIRHSRHATITSAKGHNNIGMHNGQINAGSDQVTLYGLGDMVLHDQGFDNVVMRGQVIIEYFNGADTYGYKADKFGYMIWSNGTGEIDGGFIGRGNIKVGMDLTSASISGSAAINLSQNQRINLDATAGDQTTGFVASANGSYSIGMTSSGYSNILSNGGEVRLAANTTTIIPSTANANVLKILPTSASTSYYSAGAIGNFAYIGAVSDATDTTFISLRTSSGGSTADRVVVSSSAIRPATDLAIDAGASTNRFVSTFSRYFRPGDGTPIWTSGVGSPEGVVTAVVGSIYTDTTGGAGTTLYVKESGTGNTGWVAK